MAVARVTSGLVGRAIAVGEFASRQRHGSLDGVAVFDQRMATRSLVPSRPGAGNSARRNPARLRELPSPVTWWDRIQIKRWARITDFRSYCCQ